MSASAGAPPASTCSECGARAVFECARCRTGFCHESCRRAPCCGLVGGDFDFALKPRFRATVHSPRDAALMVRSPYFAALAPALQWLDKTFAREAPLTWLQSAGARVGLGVRPRSEHAGWQAVVEESGGTAAKLYDDGAPITLLASTGAPDAEARAAAAAMALNDTRLSATIKLPSGPGTLGMRETAAQATGSDLLHELRSIVQREPRAASAALTMRLEPVDWAAAPAAAAATVTEAWGLLGDVLDGSGGLAFVKRLAAARAHVRARVAGR